jgi:uncharacterized protein YijF (DUF1287 family)
MCKWAIFSTVSIRLELFLSTVLTKSEDTMSSLALQHEVISGDRLTWRANEAEGKLGVLSQGMVDTTVGLDTCKTRFSYKHTG